MAHAAHFLRSRPKKLARQQSVGFGPSPPVRRSLANTKKWTTVDYGDGLNAHLSPNIRRKLERYYTEDEEPAKPRKLDPFDTKQLSRSITDLPNSPKSPMLRQRTSSEEKSQILRKEFGLRAEQSKAIRNSWKRMADLRNFRGSLVLMEKILNDLYHKDEKMRKIFIYSACFRGIKSESSDMATRYDHAKFLVWLMNEVVDNLEKDATKILHLLDDIGQKHNKLKVLGFGLDFWDKFGQKFVEVFLANDCFRRPHETAKAWTILIAGVVDVLAKGFTKKNRGVNGL